MLSSKIRPSELSNHYIESWFAAASDCNEEYDDSGYLYITYDINNNTYKLLGDDLTKESIQTFESAGFPRGILKPNYCVTGTYKEMCDYINKLIGYK